MTFHVLCHNHTQVNPTKFCMWVDDLEEMAVSMDKHSRQRGSHENGFTLPKRNITKFCNVVSKSKVMLVMRV